MAEPKTIYCPKCGRKVATYDGRASVDISSRCKICRKTIIYRVSTGEIEVKPLPERTTSSGGFFY